MVKRGKLEIIKDILDIINQNRGAIRSTPLLRKSNLSTGRFNEYIKELIEKEFVIEKRADSGRLIELTEKGSRFLEKYSAIKNLIDEFDL